MLQPIQEALRRNDNDTAIRLAKHALTSLPSSPDLLHLLALAQLQKGLHEEGEETLTQAIALAPERSAFHVTRADLSASRGDVNGAESHLKTAISHDPNQLAGYLGLARIALSRGQVDAAETQLKVAKRVNADHPTVLRIQGQIALTRNDTQGAIAALNRAAQLQPSNPELHFELAVAFQRHRLPAVAAQALRNAIKLNPSMAVAQRLLVSVLLEGGEKEEARTQLQELLKQRPADPGGWGLLGGIELDFGNAPAAEHALLQSLVLAPEQPLLVSRLLDLWNRTEAGERARTGLDAVLKHQPGSAMLWNARFGLDALGDDGVAVLQRWREAMPDTPDADEADAQRAEALGDTARAEELAESVVKREPGRVGAAMVLVRRDRRSDPQAAIARLAELSREPLDPGIKRSVSALLGALLDQLNHTEQAFAAWSGSVRVDGDSQTGGQTLPAFLPAGPELAGKSPRGSDIRLLWALPGSPARAVFNALGKAQALLVDRFHSDDRRDGLGPLRARDGHHGAEGAEALWRKQLADLGVDPATVVDALPHCDAAMLSSIPEARLLVLVADPRDLLLSWIAFGSAQGYIIETPELLARWLAQACEVLVQRRKAAPDRTALLKVEALQSDPEAALAGAARFLGMDGEPGPYSATDGDSDSTLKLAPGRWRAYSGVLGEAFATLQPAAVALGYEA